MNHSSQPKTIPPEAKYVPYFYESGLFQRYERPRRNAPVTMTIVPPGVYNFTSDKPILVNPDQPQTVEQIISNGYFTVPTSDPVTTMITDKKHTAWLGIDDVIGQIRRRYEIYDTNIGEIEQAKCRAVNVFLVHYDKVRPAQPDDRIYYSLNKNLQRLYQQQCDERVNLWRDISRLRQSLPENAQQYLTSYRKASLLENKQGDSP